MMNSRASIVWFAILLLALIVRVTVAAIGLGELEADPDAYKRIAVNWATSGTMGFESEAGEVTPTAYRPPLYPWLLSWFVFEGELSSLAIAALHLVLGASAVVVTYAIGRRLRLRFAVWAAVGVAIDPLLLRGAQLAMTETLATCLAALAWWFALNVWPPIDASCGPSKTRTGAQWLSLAGCSLVLGASVLARPTAAPWVGLILLAMLWSGCSCWKRRINDWVLVALGLLVCIAPWTLRNYGHFGKPIWATTHGGYTLLLANNPSLYEHFAAHGPSRAWDAQSFHDAWAARTSIDDVSKLETEEYWLKPLEVSVKPRTEIAGQQPYSTSELAQDQLAYNSALATIQRSPLMFVLSCIYRVMWLWALWPYDGLFGLSDVMIALWYSLLFNLAAVGLWHVWRRGEGRAWMFGITLVISLTIVHAVYWSNMRMRSPAIPCVMLLAAAALQVRPRRMNTSPITINTPPTI